MRDAAVPSTGRGGREKRRCPVTPPAAGLCERPVPERPGGTLSIPRSGAGRPQVPPVPDGQPGARPRRPGGAGEGGWGSVPAPAGPRRAGPRVPAQPDP